MIITTHQHFCDRCAVEYDPNELPRITVHSATLNFHNGLSHVTQPVKSEVLCPSCSRELLAWWRMEETT